MGGKISVDSTLGLGTTFEIEFTTYSNFESKRDQTEHLHDAQQVIEKTNKYYQNIIDLENGSLDDGSVWDTENENIMQMKMPEYSS